MLYQAKAFEQALNDKIALACMDDRLKWWHGPYEELKVEIDNTAWNRIQQVSVDSSNNICGYFNAHVHHPNYSIDSLSCINFGSNKMLFAKDLISFLKCLVYTKKFRKISWRVTIGNPVEAHYDKLVKRLGGRIVGIERYDVFINREYYDSKLYEWVNDYYECYNCGFRTKKEEEVMCWKCGLGEMLYHNPFKY